jgi:hypothetical protein
VITLHTPPQQHAAQASPRPHASPPKTKGLGKDSRLAQRWWGGAASRAKMLCCGVCVVIVLTEVSDAAVVVLTLCAVVVRVCASVAGTCSRCQRSRRSLPRLLRRKAIEPVRIVVPEVRDARALHWQRAGGGRGARLVPTFFRFARVVDVVLQRRRGSA